MKFNDPREDSDPSFDALIAAELRTNPIYRSDIEKKVKSTCLVCKRSFTLSLANKNRLGRNFCSDSHLQVARQADKREGRKRRR